MFAVVHRSLLSIKKKKNTREHEQVVLVIHPTTRVKATCVIQCQALDPTWTDAHPPQILIWSPHYFPPSRNKDTIIAQAIILKSTSSYEAFSALHSLRSLPASDSDWLVVLLTPPFVSCLLIDIHEAVCVFSLIHGSPYLHTVCLCRFLLCTPLWVSITLPAESLACC